MPFEAVESAARSSAARARPSRRDVLLITLAAGLGYGFDAYAVNLFGILGPTLMSDFHLTPARFGLIGSVFLVGYTIGTVGFGRLADRFGRRRMLGWSILLYGTTTALGGLTTSPVLFALLRLLTGIGGAGELAVGAPYTAEAWHKRWRGVGVGGVLFSFFSAGYVLAAAVALVVVPRYGWRWTFLLALLPAILVFSMRRVVPESADYLAHRDDASVGVRLWRLPGAGRRLLVGWLIYIPNTCGYWTITVFLTAFMVRKFHVTPQQAILDALCFYLAQFCLCYVGTALSDMFGRRPAGIAGAVLMIGCTIIASTATTLTVFLVFGGAMVALLGWLWGIGDAYMSEFFRTTHRATGFGLMVGGGRLVSIAAPTLVGLGIGAFGPTLPFLATALLWVATVAGYLLGPETARRELEEVQI